MRAILPASRVGCCIILKFKGEKRMNKKRYQSVIIFCLSGFVLTLGGCGGSGSGGSTTAVAPPIVPPAVRETTTITSTGISQDATYTATGATVTSITDKGVSTTGASVATTYYNDDGTIQKIAIKTPFSSVTWDKTNGDTIDDSDVAVVAANASGSNIGVVINAENDDVGWSYQTFGLWETGLDTGSGTVGAITVGTPTAGSAIPENGTATFTGVSGGVYVDPTGATNYITASALSADVNFSTRSIALTTAATTKLDTSSTTGIKVAASDLDMTGTLIYSRAVNSFAGNVTATGGLTGTSKGQFYGPNAEELGGVFSLKSTGPDVAGYQGAYGAKQ